VTSNRYLLNKKTFVKKWNNKDYLLLSGDPKVIGLAIAVACDINNGKYTTLTWDRQEKMYYPTEFNIHERGEIDDPNDTIIIDADGAHRLQ